MPRGITMTDLLPEYSLSDRYTKDEGRVFLSGIQALARIPVEQLRIDRRNQLNTAAFISGDPGSPVGGFDQETNRKNGASPSACDRMYSTDFSAMMPSMNGRRQTGTALSARSSSARLIRSGWMTCRCIQTSK